MTKTEAIEYGLRWKNAICDRGDTENSEAVQFLNMAIEALEQEQERQEDIYECPNCLGEVHINYIYCPFCGIRMESEEE